MINKEIRNLFKGTITVQINPNETEATFTPAATTFDYNDKNIQGGYLNTVIKGDNKSVNALYIGQFSNYKEPYAFITCLGAKLLIEEDTQTRTTDLYITDPYSDVYIDLSSWVGVA